MTAKQEAYVLGYFLADGYIRKSHSNGGFESKDQELISNIAKLFGRDYRHRQRVNPSGNISDLYVFNLHADECRWISSHYSNYKEFYPYFNSLQDDLKHEFIKGFFDGDGSICFYHNQNIVRVIFYTISEDNFNIIDTYLKSLDISYSLSIDKRGHEIKQISIGNQRSIKKLFEYWYGDIYLTRKYRIFETSIEMVSLGK